MADPVQRILAKFDLDTSNWKGVVSGARKLIQDVTSDDKQRAAANTSASKEAIDLLNKELSLIKQINSVKSSSGSSDTSKLAEIRQTAAAQKAAADQQLQSIQVQIAAENQKAAASRAAMVEQRRAAQAAMDQSKQNIAEQRRIQSEAQSAARAALNDVKRGPQFDNAQIPINRVNNQNRSLPERDAQRVDQRDRSALVSTTAQVASAEAVGESAASTAALNESQQAATVASYSATESYKAQSAALIELRVAQTNLAETQAAIASGTMREDVAEKNLATDLQRLEIAQRNLSAITQQRANAEAEAAAKIDAAQQKEIASLRKLELEKERERRAASVPLFGRESRLDTEEDEDSSPRSRRQSGGGIQGLGISKGREARDTLDALSGRMTTGPIAAAANMVPGLMAAADAAFVPLGILTMVAGIKDAIQALGEYQERLRNFPDTVRRAFGEQTLSIESSTDQLRKSTDEINNSMARFEHRPGDELKIKFDNDRLAADELAESANRAYESISKLLDANSFGPGDALFAHLHNLMQAIPGFKQLTDMVGGDSRKLPTDTTAKLKQSIDEGNRTYADAASRYQQSMNDPNATKEQRAAYLKTLNDADNARKSKLENQLKQFKGGDSGYTETLFGVTRPVSADYAKQQQAAGLGKNITTPDQNEDANYNKITMASSALNDVYKQQEARRAKEANDDAQDKQRKQQIAAEEAQWELQTQTAKYQSLKALAEANLSDVRNNLQREQEETQASYRKGETNAAQYYGRLNALAKEQLDATLANIAKQEQYDLTMLAKRAPVEHMSAAQQGFERSRIQTQYGTQRGDAQQTYNRTVATDNQGERQAEVESEIAVINLQTDAKKRALDLENTMVRESYQNQLTSAKEYLSASLDIIKQQTDAVVSGETQKQAVGMQTTQRIESVQKQIDAYANAMKQVAELRNDYVGQASSQSKSRFDQQYGALTDQSELLKTTDSGIGDNKSQIAIAEQQRNLLLNQIDTQKQLLSQADQYSKTWFEISGNILKSVNQAEQLSQHIREMQDLAPTFGNLFSTAAQTGREVFTSRFAQGLFGSLANAGSFVSNSQKYADAIRGRPQSAISKDPAIAALETSAQSAGQKLGASGNDLSTFSSAIRTASSTFSSALDALSAKIQALAGADSRGASGGNDNDTALIQPSDGGALDPSSYSNNSILNVGGDDDDDDDDSGSGGGFGGFVKNAASGLTGFTKQLSGAISAVGGFAQSITGAQSATSGALSGGLSGGSLGAQFGGPAGALIGAAGGALLGSVFGSKQEKVEDDINQLNATYKGIMNNYSANNSSLQATIVNLQSLVATATAEMDSSKKGGSQYKDLIQQYNDQIVQLEAQQEQKLASLKQSLIVLGQASPYQDMLSSVQSILQQYEEFAGAAQNANDLAQANQFLAESLQQLNAQYSQQLNQDQTQAIQDALQLNDLYTQRNQLNLQYLQQTQSIIGQGTLTRQLTQSQSKYSQLYGLDVNYQNQKQDLDEQISAEQYKVGIETQIFNLAQTRQGLEMQLLASQKVGIDYDMQRIVALKNVVQTIQGGFSVTGVSSSDPNTALTQLLTIFTTLLGGSSQSSLLNSLLASGLSSNVASGLTRTYS